MAPVRGVPGDEQPPDRRRSLFDDAANKGSAPELESGASDDTTEEVDPTDTTAS